jgi:hypothetical protein
MEVSGQLYVPVVLPPLDRRLSGLKILSGHGGEENNSQPSLGLEAPIVQPAAQRYTADLSRLPFPFGIYFKL